MDELRTRDNFGVENELVVLILLGSTAIDRFINLIHQSDRKIDPYLSQPEPVLMVHEAESPAENDRSDTHQEVTKDMARLMTSTRFDPKYIWIAQQVALKAMCKTPV